MHIKTFIANTTQEALAQVKAELGAEAVILTSRQINRDGVSLHEITAGVDNDLSEAVPQASCESHSPHSPHSPRSPRSSYSSDYSGAARASHSPTTPGMAGPASIFDPCLYDSRPSAWPHVFNDWHKDWSALRESIFALLKPSLRMDELAPRQKLALNYLQKEGVDDEIIISLYRKLQENKDLSVLACLTEFVAVKPWGFKDWPDKIHAITGPFGSGKTTAALRFAMCLKDQRPGTKIALINGDCTRGHGRLMLKHYCELLEITTCDAHSPEDMDEALRRCKSADKIIIDLPPAAQGKNLEEHLEQMGINKSVPLHLTLSPHYDANYLRSLFAMYPSERISSLIWTKLDEASSYGALVNISSMFCLPVSAVSFAPELAGSLLPADKSMLWHILFKHQLPVFNSRQYDT